VLFRSLGTCAHIVSLRRTAVGPFLEADAISLESLQGLRHSAAALEILLPVETALDDIPALALSESEASRLRSGQAVSLLARSDRDRIGGLAQGSIVCAMSASKPVALARYEAGELQPVRVLNL
jgi:tRNA pseudouridine55 synthase